MLESRPDRPFLLENSSKFLNTDDDVFFYIKSDEKSHADRVLDKLKTSLVNECSIGTNKLTVTESNAFGNTHLIHGCFREGLANPADHETVDRLILVGVNGNGRSGSTYMFTQKFKFNWQSLETKSHSAKENLFGRKIFDLGIIPDEDNGSHIRRAHKVDNFPPPCNVLKGHCRIFRASLPYGEITGKPGREEGAFHVSIAQSTSVFHEILQNMAGDPGGTTNDALMEIVSAQEGTYWYVPSTEELDIQTEGICRVDLDTHWKIDRGNDYIFYNHRQYLHNMEKRKYRADSVPSCRIRRLLQYTFEQWNHNWLKKIEVPDIPSLSEVAMSKSEERFSHGSIPLRKGLAIKKSLGEVITTCDVQNKMHNPSQLYGWKADIFNIHPDEIIVGHLPKSSSLGLGRQVMRYLTDEERRNAFLKGLSEVSGCGHVIPDYEKLLRLGISGLSKEISEKMSISDPNVEKKEFYTSCNLALEGLKMYIKNHGTLAEYLASKTNEYNEDQRRNLRTIASRMKYLAEGKPRDLAEAVQLIFSMHCCLHLTGEPVSVGRLDQLLARFVDTKEIQSKEYLQNCQDIIDNFWIKFSERVILDPSLAADNTEWGYCAVPFSSDGTFPRGGNINQWVQQVTVGGYYANKTKRKNAKFVALLCLKAARRLPLNAPCLSLRVHKGTDDELLREASKSLLSGSAHPILPHDDRIIKALEDTPLLEGKLTRSDAREYACDGCYEPLISGKSQFAFTYLPLPKVIELTLNQGKTYLNAGPAYLEGTPSSYKTKPAKDISNFQDLQRIFLEHLRIQIESGMYRLLVNYGNIWSACPTPLLSTLIDGCLQTGRDLYNGGATYNISACMFIGFSTCVDSLYAIKRLCFDKDSACLQLYELLNVLQNDWGYGIEELVTDNNLDLMRKHEKAAHYKILRHRALDLPKFGTDSGAVDEELCAIVSWLAENIVTIFRSVVKSESGPFHDLMEILKQKYDPFEMVFCPGSGTFESYVEWGLTLGASADGRRKAMPIGSDFSASPALQDKPSAPVENKIYRYCTNKWHFSLRIYA